MGTFLVYIVKVAVCLTVLYLPYSILLRSEKWHGVNRAVLLAILAFSFVIPLVRVGWFAPSVQTWQIMIPEVIYGSSVVDVVDGTIDKPHNAPLWSSVVVLVYLVGVSVAVSVRTFQLIRLTRFISQGCLWTEEREHGVTLYCHAAGVSPFSWMNKVVISEADLESDAGEAILVHETAHVVYRHSFDTLFLLLAETLMWFNPVVWLLEADMRCIHEYQADSYVLNHGVNAKNYQLYLIRKAVGSRLQSFANGLNQSTLKKRIAMMYKKSNKWAALKYMYVLPVGAIATMAFAHPEFENRVNNPLKPVSDVKVTDLSETVKENVMNLQPGVTLVAYAKSQADVMPRDTVYRLVEEMPEFPGGPEKFMQFLAQNCKYPKEAIEKGIQGRVLVQTIVRSDGSLTGMKVVESVHPLLDGEALRVARLMPNWKPGKNKGKAVSSLFTFPVMFRLQ